MAYLELFGSSSNLPKIIGSIPKKTLHLSSFLGKNGQSAYKEMFEEGFNEKMKIGIKSFKKSKMDESLNEDIPYYHGKVKSEEEEWREMIGYLTKSLNVEEEQNFSNLMQEKAPIMKEIVSELKNSQSKTPSGLSNIYLSLFQPNFEILITKNCSEKNDVKRKIFQIREKSKYDKMVPQKNLLVEIFELIE